MRWVCKLCYRLIKHGKTPMYSSRGVYHQLVWMAVINEYRNSIDDDFWHQSGHFLDWPSDIWLVFSDRHLVAFGLWCQSPILGKSPLHACLDPPRGIILILRLIANLTFCHQQYSNNLKLTNSTNWRFTRGWFFEIHLFNLYATMLEAKPQNAELVIHFFVTRRQ